MYSKVNENVSNWRFEISEGIYYVNNIESAASAVEMSVLAAKNVVNLIKSNKFTNVRDEL